MHHAAIRLPYVLPQVTSSGQQPFTWVAAWRQDTKSLPVRQKNPAFAHHFPVTETCCLYSNLSFYSTLSKDSETIQGSTLAHGTKWSHKQFNWTINLSSYSSECQMNRAICDWVKPQGQAHEGSTCQRRGHEVSSPAKAAALGVLTEVSGAYTLSWTKSTVCHPAGCWMCVMLIFLYRQTLGFMLMSVLGWRTDKTESSTPEKVSQVFTELLFDIHQMQTFNRPEKRKQEVFKANKTAVV